MAPGSFPPAPAIPDTVGDVLQVLWDAGHAAYVVGGALRDILVGLPGEDWDVATDALPERLLELFPGSSYENRFGTVAVGDVEVTTFRRDHRYADHRRPDRVTFTDSLDEDLVRRDLTINALAWGRPAGGGDAGWADPTGGLSDLDARVVRAVGDPDRRFDEDALRLVRAARIAARLGFRIETATAQAMAAHAEDVRFLAPERVGMELRKILRADPPSGGLRLLDVTGVLAPLLPELAAQRGVPQDKPAARDVWEHALRTLDAAASLRAEDEVLLLAALLHDVGKPGTFADGHFLGHERHGADIAVAMLRRLAFPSQTVDEVRHLIEEHMFGYRAEWTDAAVRRLLHRVGPERMERQLLLRQADNLGSGWDADAGGIAELRARVARQLDAGVPLALRDLAVDGRDLLAAIDRPPGPWLGALLERLLDSVIGDPTRNTRERLLADARAWDRAASADRRREAASGR